jgi:hypothetical protein
LICFSAFEAPKVGVGVCQNCEKRIGSENAAMCEHLSISFLVKPLEGRKWFATKKRKRNVSHIVTFSEVKEFFLDVKNLEVKNFFIPCPSFFLHSSESVLKKEKRVFVKTVYFFKTLSDY